MDKKKLEILNEIEKNLQDRFKMIDDVALFNQNKVLGAFNKREITNQHFAGTTGYGYTDKGKDGLCHVFADVFNAEDALVSVHLTSGTHAIATALYGLLRPKDTLLSITGDLYDTLSDTLFGKDNGSLESLGVNIKCDLLLLHHLAYWNMQFEKQIWSVRITRVNPQCSSHILLLGGSLQISENPAREPDKQTNRKTIKPVHRSSLKAFVDFPTRDFFDYKCKTLLD